MKMIKLLLVAIFCILIPFSSYAEESLEVYSKGDLHITVFITDSTSFLGEWIENPSSHALTISTVKEVNHNQSVYAGFAISGFTKGPDAKVNLVVDIQVFAPDGSILLRGEKWAVYSKEVIIDKGVIIANPFLTIKVEPNDPIGDMKISATVTDNISSKNAINSTLLKINK